MFNSGFSDTLSPEMAEELRARAHASRGTILTATSVAESGHPGGSMSSIELYTVLFSCARLRPEEPRWPQRDRIVVSHGHTSPGVYAALSMAGFFSAGEVEAHFRQSDSLFEGHVERSVPGVEWSSGNLGQGLSAGVGMALGARMTGHAWHTFVAMSDGEQQKGQIAEARRLAVARGLCDLTVVLDLNGIQISGRTDSVLHVPIVADFAADGWRVLEIDGHDVEAVYAALADAVSDTSRPVAIVAHTTIGRGVSFMEGEPEFHGRGLRPDEYDAAMAELGLPSGLAEARARRHDQVTVAPLDPRTPPIPISSAMPRTYGSDSLTDNRSAWGAALVDLADGNPEIPIAVLDCDLAVSVKTDAFAVRRPESFIQCGVGEHNAATIGGALSTCGVLTFWADFGVFGCDEAYNQQRLNDINGAALKLVLTHCGVDVGEDGKTHQCLDYVGAFRDFFGWKVIVPADPNQTDRAVRAATGLDGNVCVAMGRSKLPCILDSSGRPAFGEGYEFEYGRIDWVREGLDAVLLTMGTLSGAAVAAADMLVDSGHAVAVGVVSAPLAVDATFLTRAEKSKLIVTIEDHSVRSGLGASVAEMIADTGTALRLRRLGIDTYMPSGASSDLFAMSGLDAESIAATVLGFLGEG